MTRSANDVMQEIIFSAVLNSITALKVAAKGLPNSLLRDLNALHPNTSLADVPKELRDAIATNVRAAFLQLQKEGYVVANAAMQSVPERKQTGNAAFPDRPRSPGDRPAKRSNAPRRPDGGNKRPKR